MLPAPATTTTNSLNPRFLSQMLLESMASYDVASNICLSRQRQTFEPTFYEANGIICCGEQYLANHVDDKHFDPGLLSEMASHDVASNICQAQPEGRRHGVHVHLRQQVRG